LRSTVLLLPLPYRTVARKFSIGGLYICSWGLDILKLDKKLRRVIVLHNAIWDGVAFFEGAKPTKDLCGDATASLPLLRRPWICMLCQQTLSKRWFAKANMTSYCAVTNSVYPVKMTTIRHCSILEFGRGESN